jgi:hypothetical protein
MVLKFVISILLGRKKQYIRVVKVKNRNVLIKIEEYIPATELLQKFDD